MTDSAGTVQATYTYDPYGGLASTTGSLTNPLRFAGQYQDSPSTESGYYYLRARYYDPATAQFTTADPLVVQTRSPYSYVIGNPLNNIDPTGMKELPCSVATSACYTKYKGGTGSIPFITGCQVIISQAYAGGVAAAPHVNTANDTEPGWLRVQSGLDLTLGGLAAFLAGPAMITAALAFPPAELVVVPLGIGMSVGGALSMEVGLQLLFGGW